MYCRACCRGNPEKGQVGKLNRHDPWHGPHLRGGNEVSNHILNFSCATNGNKHSALFCIDGQIVGRTVLSPCRLKLGMYKLISCSGHLETLMTCC